MDEAQKIGTLAIEKMRLGRSVEFWMMNERKAGRPWRASLAPDWLKYEAADKAFDQALWATVPALTSDDPA